MAMPHVGVYNALWLEDNKINTVSNKSVGLHCSHDKISKLTFVKGAFRPYYRCSRCISGSQRPVRRSVSRRARATSMEGVARE